jgi:surfeit locus 1 family protein
VIRFRPLPLMTVLMLSAFAVLLVLGRWQWERYELKINLAHTPVAEMTLENYEPIEDGLQFVSGVRDGEPGWRVFAPVRSGDTVVFVDADFIPGVETPDWREVRFPAALRTIAPVSGASIRPEPPGAFAFAPRPLQRIWFSPDLAAMGRTIGVENVADFFLAAPYVGVDGRSTPNPFAHAPGVDPLPPARHLGYALTWWGLAAVLLGVYFAYHGSVGRLRFAAPRAQD